MRWCALFPPIPIVVSSLYELFTRGLDLSKQLPRIDSSHCLANLRRLQFPQSKNEACPNYDGMPDGRLALFYCPRRHKPSR
jgi:hypothetical protein